MTTTTTLATTTTTGIHFTTIKDLGQNRFYINNIRILNNFYNYHKSISFEICGNMVLKKTLFIVSTTTKPVIPQEDCKLEFLYGLLILS